MKVRIPQVVLHDGVVWDRSNRPFEFIERLLIPPLFEVGPAQTIDKIAVVGLDGYGTLNRIDRFVDSQTTLRIHVAQVIQGTRMLGLEADGTLHLLHGGLEITEL